MRTKRLLERQLRAADRGPAPSSLAGRSPSASVPLEQQPEAPEQRKAPRAAPVPPPQLPAAGAPAVAPSGSGAYGSGSTDLNRSVHPAALGGIQAREQEVQSPARPALAAATLLRPGHGGGGPRLQQAGQLAHAQEDEGAPSQQPSKLQRLEQPAAVPLLSAAPRPLHPPHPLQHPPPPPHSVQHPLPLVLGSQLPGPPASSSAAAATFAGQGAGMAGSEVPEAAAAGKAGPSIAVAAAPYDEGVAAAAAGAVMAAARAAAAAAAEAARADAAERGEEAVAAMVEAGLLKQGSKALQMYRFLQASCTACSGVSAAAAWRARSLVAGARDGHPLTAPRLRLLPAQMQPGGRASTEGMVQWARQHGMANLE